MKALRPRNFCPTTSTIAFIDLIEKQALIIMVVSLLL